MPIVLCWWQHGPTRTPSRTLAPCRRMVTAWSYSRTRLALATAARSMAAPRAAVPEAGPAPEAGAEAEAAWVPGAGGGVPGAGGWVPGAGDAAEAARSNSGACDSTSCAWRAWVVRHGLAYVARWVEGNNGRHAQSAPEPNLRTPFPPRLWRSGTHLRLQLPRRGGLKGMKGNDEGKYTHGVPLNPI